MSAEDQILWNPMFIFEIENNVRHKIIINVKQLLGKYVHIISNYILSIRESYKKAF